MCVNGSELNEHSLSRTLQGCFLPSFGSQLHLAKRLQRRFFRNQPIRNRNCLWRSCLLTDRNLMRNLYSGPSNDASYHVSDHLAKRFQRRRFLEIDQSETCLLMDRDKMSNLYRGPPIDASYQVSVHLAKRFQRRRILKISQSETRIACGGHVC